MAVAERTPNKPEVERPLKRRLVDADAHLDPRHEMWKEYLPSHLKARAPYIEEGEEHDWICFEGERGLAA